MSYEKRIMFRCSDLLYQKLQQVATAQDLKISEVARLACLDYVLQTPSQHNFIPFVGAITGGSEDSAIWAAIEERFKQDIAEFQPEVEEVAA